MSLKASSVIKKNPRQYRSELNQILLVLNGTAITGCQMSVHASPYTSRRFNPVERGGRLPVKDSVETREGLIFIRMTDLDMAG